MSFRVYTFTWPSVVALLALSAGPVAAQPPSPLELVRGLRENGQVDLAMEYLKDVESKLTSPDDKAALLLERAKCLLDASEDEPDEGTRLGMIAEAKEGLNAFVSTYPNHPRAIEGLLTTAKLMSLDAKELLSRARKMDVPPLGDPERPPLAEKQFAEAKKAQPRFLGASKLFTEASEKLRVKLEDKTLPFAVRRNLEREAFEAELASGINQFSIAETFMPDDVVSGADKELRNKFLEKAKEVFLKLGKGPSTSRAAWVARAWVAEVTYEQNDFPAAAAEVALVLRSTMLEAEDGKRLARFFQLRRNARAALGANDKKKIDDSVKEMRGWLNLFGNARKPTPEVFAVRYFLARTLQYQADVSTINPKEPAKPLALSADARKWLEDAEKLYRELAQSDHEYTLRASRNRMTVVRKLLGDADQNPLAYATFEKAQMASLIQLGKLFAAESKEAKLAAAEKPEEAKIAEAKAEIKVARQRVIGLLERARELATPQDHAPDVIDVQLRLIYFYQQNEQFYQAAVLGEFVSRTIKSTGGKAAIAGLLGVNGYVSASRAIKGDDPEAARAARQADRERAATLARFLDDKYPNDNATDSARHRLASMLVEDKMFLEAFNVLVKLRPSYAQLTNARLLQGYVVAQLVTPLDSPLSKEDKARLFRRATSDLAKVPKPVSVASADEVRSYLSARCRLASMMFAQDRADMETERVNLGFNQALHLSGLIVAEVSEFESMLIDPKAPVKKLNMDGMEMHFLALDAYTRALYLRARAMTNNGQFDGALELIQPTLEQVSAGGPLITAELREWAAGGAAGDAESVQKAKIAGLAANIDKGRVDVILAGFRVQVRQGKSAEASKLLDLMVKAGGTIDDSLPLLEPVGRELAALMVAREKEGKAAEAKNLGVGLGILLDKIRSVKTLSVPSLLFIAQTLQSIGKNAEAIETAKKVPAPTYPDWDKKKTDEFPEADRGKLLNQIRDHALAQYVIAKAQIELKQFAEAEKLLKSIVGEPMKPGWGSGRLYFRQAMAHLYEAKGAAEVDPKKAKLDWGAALQEWGVLFGMYRNKITTLPQVPKEMTAEQMNKIAAKLHQLAGPVDWFHSSAEQLTQVSAARNSFADAFFEVQRVSVAANQQLLKGQTPDKIQLTYDKVGKQIADIEKQIPAADWDPVVQNRYHELLKANPPLLAVYKTNGGKLFVEKMAPRP